MANIFELNINLNKTGESEAKKALKKTINGNAEDEQEEGSLKTALNAIGSSYFAKEAYSNIAKPILDLQLNKYGVIYGDQARQNKINNMTSTVSSAVSMTTSTLSGYAAGAALGSGGAGAIITLALELVGTAIDMVGNAREYNENQLNYMYNSNYSQERLGILASSKGR